MGGMLKICQDVLPQSLLSYVAFRVAFRDTWDQWLANGTRPDAASDGWCGYLAEVPILRETAPQIQLDLLARTWRRHLQPETIVADLLDESVLYAVCETAAGLMERSPERVVRGMSGGPIDVGLPIDHDLAAEIRGLYLKLSNEGDFLMAGQFLDMAPDTGLYWKQQLGVDIQGLESLFDALGRWHVAPEFPQNLAGLLTDAEIADAAATLKLPCPT